MHFYTFKGFMKDEPGPETSYKSLPYKTSISPDCLFMLVTLYDGTTHVLSLPPPPNPVTENLDAPTNAAPAPGANLNVVGAPATPSGDIAGRDKGFIKAEIEDISPTEHDLEELKVHVPLTTPNAEDISSFEDPFKYVPDPDEEEKTPAPPEPAEPVETEPPPKCEVGKAAADSEGGDATLLYRPPSIEPFAFFIRSLYVARSETKTSKAVKKVMITTGVAVAFKHTSAAKVFLF